ncbi:DSBA oxidoreductase [Nostoc linckia z18]|uniref:DSBA oxidoreductase n=2 Tax=Nostoc linckia TaxID=92942 RepID=A0A9Q5ZAF3_NOSLI|nr:DsbA family protein [Nostoc linckia]PHK40630.1 DSBA oxidoreductase [Nostoc linckia z15]PHK44485.1 DSBA oxidoreductase [Nostoc linckia z16]PHJ58098.1 DSBA oxidoreductase [Nostoc linckia z1]PHJ60637.1 DSBA oxidoreductase [Nostoc linckia z3]PHJ65635.1 DSBA oxidoreductase [Nostoc linckia z2]
MTIFFSWFRQLVQSLRTLPIIGILCLLFTWSLPAQAANRIDPQLEQQVLQIIREHPEVIIESVQAYQQQQQQKLNQVRQAFLQDLKTNPQTVIGNSPTTGATNSKILLVEFSDFQCPYCAEAHKTLKQLLAKYQGKIKLVYKHLPLAAIHPQALPAAAAAWAAHQQGKFWEYHDALFTNQKQLSEALYLDIAKNLNLDLVKFQRDQTLATPAIQKDIQLAEKLAVAGTPFFVISTPTISRVVQLSDIENILSNTN